MTTQSGGLHLLLAKCMPLSSFHLPATAQVSAATGVLLESMKPQVGLSEADRVTSQTIQGLMKDLNRGHGSAVRGGY